jgi:hypothetical protein
MHNLSKYYRKAAIYPLLFSVIVGFMLVLTHDGSGYKSEWFTNDGFGETIALAISLSVLIAALSSTLFFNSFHVIKAKSLYSFLCWTIPATLICVYIIYQELDNFLTADSTCEGSRIIDGYIMSVALVHLIGMVTTYIFFRKHLRDEHSG